MNFVDRPKLRTGKYDQIIDAVGKLSGDNALELNQVEYDQTISIRTMIWANYGSGKYRTKYDKHTKELLIWKL
jgi:hypothetical protein